MYEEALAITRDIGNRDGERTHLGNLGNCHASLGDCRNAIDLHEAALAIARETGNRDGERTHLGNLGNCHLAMGDYTNAIEHLHRALEISRQTGYRYNEATQLTYLARTQLATGQPGPAEASCRAAIGIADEIGGIEPRAEARVELARALLVQGDPAQAYAVASEAQTINYPPVSAETSLLAGIALLHLARPEEARDALQPAGQYADQLLALTKTPAALDARALALCGLSLTGADRTNEAETSFADARTLTMAPGVIKRTLGIFDLLADVDRAGTLGGLRAAAQGATDN